MVPDLGFETWKRNFPRQETGSRNSRIKNQGSQSFLMTKWKPMFWYFLKCIYSSYKIIRTTWPSQTFFMEKFLDIKSIQNSIMNPHVPVTQFQCEKHFARDFPGGPVAKTPCSQCRRPGFNPCSGNLILHVTTKMEDSVWCNLRPGGAK